MKFCEKLQKLRKEKGYSQEQLADLLDVSRQSVSKWESGTTYPEMDKLLSLCKIFDVTLDDLTNDEISDTAIKEKSKSNFSNLVYTILDMLNKSIEMFKSMNKKEILKCLSELFILFIILLIFKIPFSYINDLMTNVLINFSDKAFSITNSIWLLLSNTLYLILFFTIFIYVYKIRFLDKYDKYQEKPSENKEIENTDNIGVIKEKKVSEESGRSYIIFDALGSIFNIIIKICLLFIVVPLIVCFICLVIFTFISLIIQFIGVHYIGIFIALLGSSIALFIIMELFIRYLFSSPIKFKRMFITFSVGLIIAGLGVSLFTFEIANTKYIDSIPEDISLNTTEYIYDMQDDFLIYEYYDMNYQVDESLTDQIKVQINYYSDYFSIDDSLVNNTLYIHSYNEPNNVFSLIYLIKENLMNKTFYNYDLLSNIEIVVISSSQNITKLKDNWNNYLLKQQEENNNYNYYNQRIAELEEELENKHNEIYELQEKINSLEEKLQNIEDLVG